DLASVGARQDPGLRIEPLGARSLDLGLGQFHRHNLLAGHVAAALGPLLVLDQDRADAHALVALHGVHHVLDVAVAVVAVDEHRRATGRHDVARAGGALAEALEPDVGHAIARADRREAADEIGLKADLLDDARAERVMRPRHHQKALFLYGLVDDLAKT